MWSAMKRVGRQSAAKYAAVSNKRPYLVSSVSATAILTCSDLTCQAVERLISGQQPKPAWDWRRTLSLAVFGCLYYGGPMKFIYLTYDRLTLGPGKKTIIDVCLHTPFLLIPSYYMMTGPIKGFTLNDSFMNLQAQWFESSTGSVAFWLPMAALNFRFVPPHSRVLVISCFSFIHKAWLSWISNRQVAGTAGKLGAAAYAVT